MKKRFLVLVLLLLCMLLFTGCTIIERNIFGNITLPPEYGSAAWVSQNPEISFTIIDNLNSAENEDIYKYNGEITINGELKNVWIFIENGDKYFEIYEADDEENRKLLHAYFVSSNAEEFVVSIIKDAVYDNEYKEIVFRKNQ